MTAAKEFVNVFPDIVHIVRQQDEIVSIVAYVSGIVTWCNERKFDAQLTNTWSENDQQHICFRVNDEAHRLLFALKWT